MRIKHNKNGVWVDGKLYKCINGVWVDSNAYTNNNGSWEDITPPKTQIYEKTWTASWSQSYHGSNTKRDTSYLYQGQAQGSNTRGVQRSLIGFDTGQISRELKGANIIKCIVKFYSAHTWYSTGATYRIGFHNHATKPSKFSIQSPYKKDVKGGKPSWVTIDFTKDKLAENIRDGSTKGIGFYCGSSSNLSYYGYVQGVGMSSPPTITITYEK